jgi:hypothetical protein
MSSFNENNFRKCIQNGFTFRCRGQFLHPEPAREIYWTILEDIQRGIGTEKYEAMLDVLMTDEMKRKFASSFMAMEKNLFSKWFHFILWRKGCGYDTGTALNQDWAYNDNKPSGFRAPVFYLTCPGCGITSEFSE